MDISAFRAGVLGLAINYSAYEAENYRAGLLAIPRGQMEAAPSLGMSYAHGALAHRRAASGSPGHPAGDERFHLALQGYLGVQRDCRGRADESLSDADGE